MQNSHLSLDDGMLVVTNYNQIEEISNFLDRAEKYFPKEQTIVVDDGSTDSSPDVAKQRGYNVIVHQKNSGTGSAIRTGINYAKQNGYKWVVLSSSNGKIKPEEYNVVYQPILDNSADYVTGSRFMKGGLSPELPLFRKVSIPLFSLFTSIFLHRYYSDVTCGFRAYRLDLFDRLKGKMDLEQEWLNRYELEYYIHYYISRDKTIRVKEVPVTIEYSHLGKNRKSKIKPIIGWWSMVRPFVFLSLGYRH